VRRAAILLVIAVAACGDSSVAQVAVALDPAGAPSKTPIPAAAHVTVSATAPGGMVDLEIDCHPSNDAAQIDVVGFHFSISAPALGVTDEPERAGYFRKRTMVAAGPITVTLDSDSGPASCDMRLTPAPSACGGLTVFHSINTDHTHVPTTTIPSTWEKFPVSGDHYPIWAPWNMSFPLPPRLGYLVHDLEHGGIVLTYACENALQSADCTKAQADLAGSRSFSPRMNDSPDPTQPSLYAARTWRWGLLADCFDAEEMLAFYAAHFDHGREDISSDYPAPFDPTQP
jgi:hypothetical protein